MTTKAIMSKTLDLFPDTKPPRAKPRKLMHFNDVGYDNCACFECKRCGFEDWFYEMTMTEIKRGIPCPNCNKEEVSHD